MAAKRKSAAAQSEPDIGLAADHDVVLAVCVIDGCDRPVYVRGLCAGHWESPRGAPADT
jgi:hypothetical protein